MSAVDTLHDQAPFQFLYQLKIQDQLWLFCCVPTRRMKGSRPLKLKPFYSADLITVHKPNTGNAFPTTCHT